MSIITQHRIALRRLQDYLLEIEAVRHSHRVERALMMAAALESRGVEPRVATHAACSAEWGAIRALEETGYDEV